MKSENILAALPVELSAEFFENLLLSPSVRIERIVSKGHISPENGWYDQEEHEWVIVLQGSARLEFEDNSICNLVAGDYVNIPAHHKHKVSWTDPNKRTIWLAVFYK